MERGVFWFFFAAAVVSAAMCVLRRHPVSAAMWLVATMFSLAGIFVLLDAPFLAAIQVLVYAGAVMVLFLFVIMLLNLAAPTSDLRGPLSLGTAVAVAGLLVVELGALWIYSPARLATELMGAPEGTDPMLAFPAALGRAPVDNVVLDVAQPLFGPYLVPFEVTGFLLLAALVGAVVLAKRRI
jgi:NADH-quinone oxidoreductase subunit J